MRCISVVVKFSNKSTCVFVSYGNLTDVANNLVICGTKIDNIFKFVGEFP